MFGNYPVQVSLEVYLAFLAGLAVILTLLFWVRHKVEKRKRHDFFAQFNRSDLRMSPYQIGLVYRVVGG